MMKIQRMKIKFFDIEVYDEYKVCNELTFELCSWIPTTWNLVDERAS